MELSPLVPVMSFALLVVYFLPTIVALNRKHHSTLAIFMLNPTAWPVGHLLGYRLRTFTGCTGRSEQPVGSLSVLMRCQRCRFRPLEVCHFLLTPTRGRIRFPPDERRSCFRPKSKGSWHHALHRNFRSRSVSDANQRPRAALQSSRRS